jgi:hypothetical protein
MVTTGAFVACQSSDSFQEGENVKGPISDWPPRSRAGGRPISDWPSSDEGFREPGEEPKVPGEADGQEDEPPSSATLPNSDTEVGDSLDAGAPATPAVGDAGAAEADTGTHDAGLVQGADASTEASADPS